MTPEGYFLDCWPAFDRLARVMQRQIDGAYWGPLLDHGVGFNFDCWNHYLETGDLAALDEPYPRLAAVRRLPALDPRPGRPAAGGEPRRSRRSGSTTSPTSSSGTSSARSTSTRRPCSQHALAPLGPGARRRRAGRASSPAAAGTCWRPRCGKFWSPERGLFVNNLPWLAEEKQPRLCDRSLATAILFDQCPGGNTAASLQALVECPAEMGLSYPCNACWRYWALARLGRADVVVREFRQRWATMKSVAA